MQRILALDVGERRIGVAVSDPLGLTAQGVEKIIFVTNGATSAFMLSDLLEKGESGETYKLTHNDSSVSFTIGEKENDISSIIE